jgi:hypothetical protein
MDQADMSGQWLLTVEPLRQRDGLRALHAMAIEAFDTDAMPWGLVDQLHWAGRESVFLLLDAAGLPQGYLAAFMLRPKLWQELINGETDPLTWSADQLDLNPWRGPMGGLYLESTFVRPAARRLGVPLLVASLFGWIKRGLEPYGQDSGIEVAGLAASESGARLLRRTFGLSRQMAAHMRRDQMDLYTGRFEPASLARRLQRLLPMTQRDGRPAKCSLSVHDPRCR